MNPIEPSGSPAPRPPRRRRTLQSTVLMVFAVVSTGVLLCCCVPLIALNIAFGPVVATNPAKVEAVARQIAPLAVPPSFVATEARHADNSMFSIQIVKFTHKEGRGKLVVGRFRTTVVPMGDEYDSTLLQQLVDQMFPGQRLLEVKQSRTKEVSMQGKPVTFEIIEGEDVASNTRFKQVSGAFPSPAGYVQLILQAESTFVTDDALDALVDSLAEAPVVAHP